MSIPNCFLNSPIKKSCNLISKSSPPKEVSPLVAFTSNTPPDISRSDISKVPPPRSNTAIILPSDLSNPNAKAAAVGSFMILLTSKFAIFPASLVACL